MATNAQYASTPRIGIASLSAANTLRTGTGTIIPVFAAGSIGSRIDAINIKATSTTTAGAIRLFIHDGTNAHLLTELPVTAITPSATVPSWEVQLNTNSMSQILPIILPSGYSLRASTEKAEAFNVLAQGGNL